MTQYRNLTRPVIVVAIFAFLSVTMLFQPTAHSTSNPISMMKSFIAVEKADNEYENKKYKAAFSSYQIAADAGNAYSQFMLANMYLAGEGVRKDAGKYLHWIRKSADKGYPSANYLLGMAYLKSDRKAAVKYFKKAARKEHGSAMHMLGLMYVNGTGVSKNTKEAIRWFRLAKAQGIPVKKQYLSQSGIDSSSITHEIQQRLTKLGYKPGPVDGLYGKKTRSAIQAFQRKEGLKPDGKASVKVLRALRK